MEESDAIIFPILKEVGCDLPSTVTSIKQVIDEHIYLIAVGCLYAIDAEISADLPRKFPTSKATKFRVASEVARLLKQIGFQGEIGYQSILYPHEHETRKIISFLIERLPRREQQDVGYDGSSSTLQMRVIQSLQQNIHPGKHYTVFKLGAQPPAVIPFESASFYPCTSTSAAAALSPAIQEQLTKRAGNTSTQSLQATYWESLHPRLEMSSITKEPVYHTQLLPAIIQANTYHNLEIKRQEEKLLAQNQQLASKLQVQLSNQLQSSMKQALLDAKTMQSQYDQQKLAQKAKLKNSALNSSLGDDNLFTRKTQFTQENTVALTTTEPIVSAEEQQAKDQAEYEARAKEREEELSKLQNSLEALFARYKQLTTNIDDLNSNITGMSGSTATLAADIESLEATYKTRCHVIDFLPNAQENIDKLKQLTESNMAKILQLNTAWESLRQDLIAEYRTLKQQHADRNALYNANLEKLQTLRAEIKSKGQDIRSKEEQFQIAAQEYENMPKSINRNIYIKRIMDIVKNIDKQNDEITTILTDIKSVQREITNKSESVKRSFAEADDLIYSTAKQQKSPVAISIYKDIVTLRDGFAKVIDNVETIGKKQNTIRELEQSIELIQDRGTMDHFNSVMQDLQAIQQENQQLKAQISAANPEAVSKPKRSTKKAQ